MIKGLFKIPPYQKSENVRFYPVEREMNNVFGVPASKWSTWTLEGREMFNFLYETGMRNPDAVFAVYKFDGGKQIDKIIAAASWNLAWMAADKISGTTTF